MKYKIHKKYSFSDAKLDLSPILQVIWINLVIRKQAIQNTPILNIIFTLNSYLILFPVSNLKGS